MPKQKLKGIQFGVLTHEQIKEIGVVEVTESTLHTKGIPKAGSGADTRFGTCSRFYRCGTCKHSVLKCPGHPGYILFPYPVPHVAFIMYMTRILNLFCFNCSCYLLEDVEFPESVQTPKKRLVYAYEEARKARARKRTPLMCPNPECGLPQPTVYVEEPFVKLAWREDLLETYFGPEITAGAHSASKKGRAAGRKRGRKSKQDGEPRQQEPTPEEQMLFEQRRADYEHFIKRPFTNWDAYNVLKSIKRTDLMHLGINAEETHPSGFMLLSLLVPAIGVRPTVSFEEGSRRRGYHQLTRKISDIVKQKRALMVEANNCKIRLGDETLAIEYPESLKHALQMFYVTVSHYLVKDKCKVPGLKLSPYAARAHARAQSASQALSGKNGRYRSTLMGKRVDFCLRTVVTPNPDADIDEIGIPEELARRLTVPIRVSHNNREALHKLMAEGGVMQVVDERTGNMIAVGDHNCESLVLMDGWIVERYLKDGDWIPINRQPTLHRPSIMGHRVKIHKDRVLKLNDAVTTPYNADHDGDEMNGHVPQTPEARAEVQELMAVTNHIMHPRGNRPVIGLIQDRLDAGYFLTHPDTFFTREQAMDLLMTIHYDRDAPDTFALGSEGARWKNPQLPPPARTQPEPLWGGKQIVSCVLPRINMERDIRNRPKGDDERSRLINRLIIRDGEMLSGTLCKQTLGTTSGGIIHLTCLYCGNNTAARFISDMQRLLNRFMVSVGFSIGIKDCMTAPAVQAKIDTVVDAAERFVGKIKDMAAEMPNDPEVQHLAEQKISGTLKSLLHMVGNVVRANLDDTNMFNVMANICGSKGSVFNMAQVMALVGPTFVNGERPNATGTNRVLPSAPLPGQKALSVGEELRMHGFIRRPYKAGLTMPDAFLHNMGGREGLVDTAAKTSRTGYLQRRAVKAMESHHIAHDGTVRDAYQKMYQCHFGNDGLNPMQTVKVTLKSLMLDNDALRRRCIADELLDPANAQHQACMVQEWTALLALRDEMRQAKITHSQTNLAQNLDVYIPFHVEILAEQERVSHGQARLTADELVRAQGYVDQVCTLLQSEVPSLFTVYHIRDEMSTGRLLGHHRIGLDSVRRLCYRVVEMHRKARLQPGEGIGALTATSTGEPLSQMTLNSVAWGTKVLFDDNKHCRVLEMGRFVDKEVERAVQEGRRGIEERPDGTIWVPLDRPVRIPSCDDAGLVKWDLVEAVTRHPVVNADGTSDLLRIETRGGRSADVTMGESVLRWDPETNTVQTCRADQLTLQDRMPVSICQPEPDVICDELDLRPFFLPSTYVHTTNTSSVWLDDQGSFSKAFREGPETPWNRSDSLLHALKKHKFLREPGLIFPKGRYSNSLPEKLPLDYETGYAFGLYAAEGCHSSTQAVWSNNDPAIMKRLTDWLDRTGVAWHTAAREVNNGTSTSTWAHSTLLAKLMPELCGHLSRGKKVPNCMYNAPLDGVRGFLDGYFSGDGSFTDIRRISATSRSKELVEGVASLLRRVGVYSRIFERVVLNDPFYEIAIQQGDIYTFFEHVHLTSAGKQCLLSGLNAKSYQTPHLRQGKQLGNVFLERIKSITRVKYEHPWAYDLTVQRTRNMQLFSGLTVRDTFHQAGTANAGMTFGVPRMKELIGASKNISTPVMTLPIKRDMANPKVAAEVLARSLPFTLLRNIIRSTDTVYEPDLMTSHVKEDVELVRQHAPFMEHILSRACPWVIRFELCKTRSGARSLEPRGIADLIQEELGDFALVISNRVQDETWAIRVYLVDVQATVDQALKKSIRTGTTRTATKRASQRVSITTRKRRRFADLSHLAEKNAEESVLPVPLHRIDPAIERTTHTSRDVIEWMVARNTQMDLKNGLKVCGIPNITAATVRVNDCTRIDASTGAVRIEEEYVVDVRGSNLAEVSMLGIIDMGRIVSNHVMAVYETLGITAAAHTLFQELSACLSASGSRVDERLIKLMVDVMTHNGFVMPISRHGLNRLREHGVLAKITFEETLEMLFEASALGYFDPLLGVSENTMVGRQARLGTNLTKMMVEHNGQRVPCKDHARCGEGPDTRVLMSVVTEECQQDFEEEEVEYVESTKELDHILTARNGNAEPAQAYETGGASAVNPALYEQHFYHQPNAMVPTEPDTNPFRPSSPTLTSHNMHQTYTEEMTEAFCPSSPVCD
jgi:DNA-directed RNA polymerase beta' subunit